MFNIQNILFSYALSYFISCHLVILQINPCRHHKLCLYGDLCSNEYLQEITVPQLYFETPLPHIGKKEVLWHPPYPLLSRSHVRGTFNDKLNHFVFWKKFTGREPFVVCWVFLHWQVSELKIVAKGARSKVLFAVIEN